MVTTRSSGNPNNEEPLNGENSGGGGAGGPETNALLQRLLTGLDQLREENNQMRTENNELRDRLNQMETVPGRGERAEDVGQRMTPHPFTDQVTEAPYHQGFTWPSLDSYDGAKDPHIHLAKFRAIMLRTPVDDATLCRAFPGTFTGSALLWYTGLPANSIGSFEEFSQKFLTQFSASRGFTKTSASLINLKQGERESLKSFMHRFNQEAMEIRDLSQEVSLHAILAGLRPGAFVDSLAMKPPRSMDELLSRAAGYINIEEVAEAKKAAFSTRPQDQTDSRRREP